VFECLQMPDVPGQKRPNKNSTAAQLTVVKISLLQRTIPILLPST
jgi:hypothetical protein